MAALTPLEQIAFFNYQLFRTPAKLSALQPLKEYFVALQQNSTDPIYVKELNKARVLLELKEEQATLAAKVEEVFIRWKGLENSVRAASSANYSELSIEITNLKKEIAGLQENIFPPERPKAALLARTEVLGRVLEQHNPNAWITHAVFQSAIGAGIGLFFANVPKAMEEALVAVDGIANHTFESSICDPASCSATASPNALLGTGLLIGVSGVLIFNTVNKVRKLATSLLSKAYTWATQESPPPVKEGRPKIENKPSNPMPLDRVPLMPLHPTKQSAYDKLTAGKAPDDWIHVTSHSLADPAALLDSKPFCRPKQPVEEKSGSFAFPASTEEVEHWTADFANPRLLGKIDGPLLGHEELLALEHPVLYHLRALLNTIPSTDLLEGSQIVLISHVGRYGDAKGRFNQPTFSNLFAMAAPQNPGAPGEPIQRQHLKELFVKSCTAFSAVANKAENAGKRAIAHTCGAGGPPLAAALTQILAARTAGIELHYYTEGDTEAFSEAEKILAALEARAPNAYVGEILVHLAAHAKEYGIVYSQS